jgi:hypothetical protein
MYTFCFDTCDKRVHLIQEQLNLIPYLSALVAHDNDFSSTQNNNGEYVLTHPFNYSWFKAILHSITLQQPYVLFNDLPVNKNVLHMLQLYDYLGISPYSVPLLKFAYLVQTNSTHIEDERKDVKYRYANMLEARQTAAEFILALTKNEYDLNDSRTIDTIYSLVMVILLNSLVFGYRFRHHMLIIVKQYCFSFFSQTQQDRLLAIQPIVQRDTNNSEYLYNNYHSLPKNFYNAFAWKVVDDSTIKNDRNYLPLEAEFWLYSPMPKLHFEPRDLLEHVRQDLKRIKERQKEIELQINWKANDDLKLQLKEQNLLEQVRIEVQSKIERELELQIRSEEQIQYPRRPLITIIYQNIQVGQSTFHRRNFNMSSLFEPSMKTERDLELELKEEAERQAVLLLFKKAKIKQDQLIDQRNLVRSGRFNTLPKRPKIDKFKYSFVSKAHIYG